MGRAPCCDKTKVKRGPWSPEEDNILINYIHENGTGGNWIALPRKAGLKRCGKSCRLRWLNYLRPGIKHGGFSEEEDHIILTVYHNIGSRWSVIASHLPGRTDNDVKNHWNTKLKKKLLPPPRSTSSPFTTTATTTTTTDNIDTIYGINSNYSVNSNDLSYFPVEAETEIPLPRLTEVPENVSYINPGLFTAAATLSSQEVVITSQLSPDSADTFLGEMDSGFMSYDLMNAFDFEGNITDQMSHVSTNFQANDSDNNEQQLPCPQSLRY